MEMLEIHNRLLEMGKVITEILDNNGFPYMITFGTLLGAVRHHGFVPWDDDFDLLLFDDSYDQAMSVLRKELPEDLFLEDKKSEPLYFHGYAHVKDLKTEALCVHYPHDNIYQHKGLSIDLYRAVRMKECDLERFLLTENIAYLKRRMDVLSIDKVDYEKRVSMLEQKMKNLECIASRKEIFGMALAVTSMDVDKVLPLKKIGFEDTMFWGPSNPEALLKDFYGDYTKLPPLENRVRHYQYVRYLDTSNTI